MKTPAVYQQRMVNADGSTSTVAAIVAAMQKSGFPQRFIDRWLQGLGYQLALAERARYAAQHTKGEQS
jgi:hypothetical protein